MSPTLKFVFLLILATVQTAPTPTIRNQFSGASQPINITESILNYGRNLSKNISESIIPNILSWNNQIYNAAGTIPRIMPPGSINLGYAISNPIRFSSLLGNTLAPSIVRNIVSRPIDVVSNRISELVRTYNLTAKPATDSFPAFSLPFSTPISSLAQIPPINIGGTTINLSSLLTEDNINAFTQNIGSVLQRFLTTQ